MSTPSYQPIDSINGQIRKLILHPASKHDAEIHCELEPVYLSTNPHYEALSYSWGTIGQAGMIYLNGQQFQVWENATAALRQLRSRSEKRYLWIDAICINQDDLGERAEQVLLMQQIYRQAVQVCVWLGELTDGGRVGMKQLQNKLSVGWHQWITDRKYGKPTLSVTKNLSRPLGVMNRSLLVEEQMNGEVREILDRPWWRRTWIMQEAVLASKIVLICGSETTSWESIQELLRRIFWSQRRIEVFKIIFNDKDRFPDDNYRAMLEYRQRWHSSPSEVNIFDILYRFRILECSDPRDKIFGFLGIIPSVIPMGIKPDYESTVAEVYFQFARKVIQASKCLDVLNCKREWQGTKASAKSMQVYSILEQSRYYDVNASILDGPNRKPRRGWARLPDGWERVPSGKRSFFRDHNTGKPQEESPLDNQPPSPAGYLTKQRVLPPGWTKNWDNLGRVVLAFGVQETPKEVELRRKKEELQSQLAKLPSWVPNWACPTPWDPTPLIDWTAPEGQYCASGSTVPHLLSVPEPVILSLNGRVFDTIRCLAQPWHPEPDRPPISGRGIKVFLEWEILGAAEVENCPYQSIGGRANALWRTMIADHVKEGAAPKDDWAYVEAWYDRIGWSDNLPEVSLEGIFDTVETESKTKHLETLMLEHFYAIQPPPVLGLRDTPKRSRTEQSRIKEKYGEYIQRIHRACAHRALFVTAMGYLGLAPWNAEVGDEVVVLNGGRTPYLLRKSATTDHRKLVGEAYVYGIMAGEALDSDIVEKREPQVVSIS